MAMPLRGAGPILTLTVPPGESGRRLDAWLARAAPGLSRSRAAALVRSGHVSVNGRPVKPSRPTRAGDLVRVAPPRPAPVALQPENRPLAILYQDADLVVVNKPAGLVVHPAAAHPDGTLVNILLHHCPDLAGVGGELRPGIAHRLDKDTSGVLVAAKHAQALANLAAQFKNRQAGKYYLALVAGIPRPAAGSIASLIGRDARERTKMSAAPRRGRPALTHYATLETFRDCALLRLRLETGRTHQIRVHLASRGHPVLGDRQYGGRAAGPAAGRQMLHAAELELRHPRDGRRLVFRAPPPADFMALLAALRRAAAQGLTGAAAPAPIGQ